MQNEDQRTDQPRLNRRLTSLSEISALPVRTMSIKSRQENRYNDMVSELLNMLRAANRCNMKQKNKYKVICANLRNSLATFHRKSAERSELMRKLQGQIIENKMKYEFLIGQKDKHIEELEKQLRPLDEQTAHSNEQLRLAFEQNQRKNFQLGRQASQLRNEIKQLKSAGIEMERHMKKQELERNQEIKQLNDEVTKLKAVIESLTKQRSEEAATKQKTIIDLSRQLDLRDKEIECKSLILQQQQYTITALEQEMVNFKNQQVRLLSQIEELNTKVKEESQSQSLKDSEFNDEEREGDPQIETLGRLTFTQTPFQLEDSDLYQTKQQQRSNAQIVVPISLLSELNENKEYQSSRSSVSSSSQQAQKAPVEEKSESYCSQEKQEDILEVELEIIKCKYKLLEKMYLELKHESEDSSTSERRAIGVQTEDRDTDFAGSNLEAEDNDNLMQGEVHEKSIKKSQSGYNLLKNGNNKLDISIVDSVKGHNKNSTALNSPTTSLHSFTSFFSSSELESKIKNYNYQASILHKINTSKFITSPSSKFSFVFQYACYLELYFSQEFLSRVMEELIMGDQIETAPIAYTDLNTDLFQKEDNSQLSSSKLSSRKLNVAQQYSMNSFPQIDECKSGSPNPYLQNTKMKEKIQKIGADLDQITSFLIRESVDVQTLKLEPAIADKLTCLADNQMAQLLLKLIKQNQIMSKCMNQMIRNQEMLTTRSNDAYFESVQIEKQSGEPQHQPEDKGSGKQNCVLM